MGDCSHPAGPGSPHDGRLTLCLGEPGLIKSQWVTVLIQQDLGRLMMGG